MVYTSWMKIRIYPSRGMYAVHRSSQITFPYIFSHPPKLYMHMAYLQSPTPNLSLPLSLSSTNPGGCVFFLFCRFFFFGIISGSLASGLTPRYKSGYRKSPSACDFGVKHGKSDTFQRYTVVEQKMNMMIWNLQVVENFGWIITYWSFRFLLNLPVEYPNGKVDGRIFFWIFLDFPIS